MLRVEAIGAPVFCSRTGSKYRSDCRGVFVFWRTGKTHLEFRHSNAGKDARELRRASRARSRARTVIVVAVACTRASWRFRCGSSRGRPILDDAGALDDCLVDCLDVFEALSLLDLLQQSRVHSA